MKCYNKLECLVRPQVAKVARHTATEIAIFLGPLLVATKICGGAYSAVQGLAEFRRNPKTFKYEAGMEAASSLKMVS